MRIVTNEAKARCNGCGTCESVLLKENGSVVCGFCLSDELVFMGTGKVFQATFGDSTYRVNRYCPEIKDRRLSDTPYPITKERRKPAC